MKYFISFILLFIFCSESYAQVTPAVISALEHRNEVEISAINKKNDHVKFAQGTQYYGEENNVSESLLDSKVKVGIVKLALYLRSERQKNTNDTSFEEEIGDQAAFSVGFVLDDISTRRDILQVLYTLFETNEFEKVSATEPTFLEYELVGKGEQRVVSVQYLVRGMFGAFFSIDPGSQHILELKEPNSYSEFDINSKMRKFGAEVRLVDFAPWSFSLIGTSSITDSESNVLDFVRKEKETYLSARLGFNPGFFRTTIYYENNKRNTDEEWGGQYKIREHTSEVVGVSFRIDSFSVGIDREDRSKKTEFNSYDIDYNWKTETIVDRIKLGWHF